MRLAEAERPQGGSVRLDGGAVHLVGHQDDRLALAAQHLHDGLVGRRGANGGVHYKEDGVGNVNGALGLIGNHAVDALGVDLPAAGVNEREVLAGPLGLVGDAVAGDAGDVLDDGLAAADDAVDQGGLADVRAADHGEDGRDRAILFFPVLPVFAGEKGGVLVAQVVFLKTGAQRGCACLGLFLGHGCKALGDVVMSLVADVVAFGLKRAHGVLPDCMWVGPRPAGRSVSF